MLWSQLKDWPADQPYPDAVRAWMRMRVLLDARLGDLTGWRFSKAGRLRDLDAFVGPLKAYHRQERAGLLVEMEEIDRVLRWRQNTDWPFR